MPRTKNKSKLEELRKTKKIDLQSDLDTSGVKGLAEKWNISKSSVYKIIKEKKLKLMKYKNLSLGKPNETHKKGDNEIINVYWPCYVNMVCKGTKCHIYYGTIKNPYWNPEYCLSIGCVQIYSAKYRDNRVFFDKSQFRNFW